MPIRVDEWKLKISESGSNVLNKVEAAANAAAKAMGQSQAQAAKVDGGAARGLRGLLAKLKGGVRELAIGAREGIEDALTESAQRASPKMASALAGAAGPLALALTFAVAGVGKALAAAAEFRPAFEQAKYATHTRGEAAEQRLNNRILGTAGAVGLDPSATAKGYADLAKTTGFVDAQADRIVTSVGRASKVLDTDFNTALKGTASTMSAFGLGASQVDAVLTANQQVVENASVTYDELTKAQGRFGRSAAAANQSVESANRLFTLFVRGTNDAAQAATLTKGALDGLAKGKTSDWLERVGVHTRDANGNLRQVDDIVKDLVPALARLNDQDFAQLRDKVGGNDGLRGMLDLARSSGVEVTTALGDMENATVSATERLEDANKSASALGDTLQNRVATAWVRMGQTMESANVQSIIAGVVDEASDLVNVLASLPDYIDSLTSSGSDIGPALAKVVQNAHTRAQSAYAGDMATANAAINDLQSKDKAVRDKALTTFNEKADYLKAERAYYKKEMEGSFTATGKAEAAGYVDELDRQMKALAERYYESKNGGTEPRAKGSADATNNKLHDALFPDKNKGGGKGTRSGVEKVVGGGAQVRNVTVTIQKLVEHIDIHSTNLKEGIKGSELKTLVTQALVDAVRGGEAALANQ